MITIDGEDREQIRRDAKEAFDEEATIDMFISEFITSEANYNNADPTSGMTCWDANQVEEAVIDIFFPKSFKEMCTE